jgi:hypothetical protein
MAFGRPDTERFYKRLLAPTIRAVGASPVRVVDLNHNDDIDNKILELLNESEIAVADLTYARPSVYFEAGHATPRIPVVYTCRADHLDNPTDQLRVHFDLQMKNIVPWRTPGDAVFQRRFGARFRKVLGPILLRQEQDRRDTEARAQFGNLAANVRGQMVIAALRELLEARGYAMADLQPVADWVRSNRPITTYWLEAFERLRATGAFLSAVQERAGHITGWVVHVATGSASRQVAQVLDAVRRVLFYNVRSAAEAPTITEHVVIVTTDAITRSMVTRRTPEAEWTGARELLWATDAVTSRAPLPQDAEIYTCSLSRGPSGHVVHSYFWYWQPTERTMLTVKRDDLLQVPVKRTVHIHLFDRVTTVDDARRRLTEILHRA